MIGHSPRMIRTKSGCIWYQERESNIYIIDISSIEDLFTDQVYSIPTDQTSHLQTSSAEHTTCLYFLSRRL